MGTERKREITMADCWNCINVNTQRCEGCLDGYMDGIDGWIQFDEPTHFEPKYEDERCKHCKNYGYNTCKVCKDFSKYEFIRVIQFTESEEKNG